jgi:hypothetical protein
VVPYLLLFPCFFPYVSLYLCCCFLPYFCIYFVSSGAGIAQSVYLLVTGCTSEGSEKESR